MQNSLFLEHAKMYILGGALYNFGAKKAFIKVRPTPTPNENPEWKPSER